MIKPNGLILAGGKSSRMEQDKALINYHGKPQLDYLCDILSTCCQEVFISAAKQSGINTDKTIIHDQFDLDSPLNGILSAFHFDPDASWLTVPVDMPNLHAASIEFLLRHRNPKKTATCFLDTDGQRPEPLVTIWEAKAKPLLFDFYNSGGFSPRKFLEEHDIELLKAPHPSMLVNLNTTEELEAFLRQSGKTLQRGS
jgi:molybdopterin-guanine dinucleotide biosynthesis protein A